MRRTRCPEGQDHLFPEAAMAMYWPAAHPLKDPLPDLPVAENDEISTARAADILGVKGHNTMDSLIESGAITCMRKHEAGRKYISYASIVAFCDSLRIKYAIEDQRKPRKGITGRRPDKELLPFPLDDTIEVPEVAEKLRVANQTVRKLCEDGTLVSYKLHDLHPWRISRVSFGIHLQKMRLKAST